MVVKRRRLNMGGGLSRLAVAMGEYKAGGDQRSFLLLAPDVMSEAAKQAATVARCLSKQMQVTLSLHFLTYCPVIRGATRRRHLLRSGCHVLGGGGGRKPDQL